MPNSEPSDHDSDGSSVPSIKFKTFTVKWPTDAPGLKAFSAKPDALEGVPSDMMEHLNQIKQNSGPYFHETIKSEGDDQKDFQTAEALIDLLGDLACLDRELCKLPDDSFPKLRSWFKSLHANLIPCMEAFTDAEDGAGSTLQDWVQGPEALMSSKTQAATLRFMAARERANFQYKDGEADSPTLRSPKYDNLEIPEDGVISYPHCPPFSAYSTKGMERDFTEQMHGAAGLFLAQGVALSGSIMACGDRHIEHTKISENIDISAMLALRHLSRFWKVLRAPTTFPVKDNKPLYRWVLEMQKTIEEIYFLPAKQEDLYFDTKIDRIDKRIHALKSRQSIASTGQYVGILKEAFEMEQEIDQALARASNQGSHSDKKLGPYEEQIQKKANAAVDDDDNDDGEGDKDEEAEKEREGG